MAIMTTFTKNLSQLKDFLSYLSTVKGDLSNVTAPPFVLAPKSALEVPSSWAACHALFLQPSQEPEPEVRALLLAKNFVCSLKYLVDEGSSDAAKKPLNPFLGELFFGSFRQAGTTTQCVAEQVSHHPPVTACCMYNKEFGMRSNGFAAQETSFSTTNGVTVRQTGYAIISDEKHDERHLITLPTLHIRGLMTGQPYPELQGPCYISSSSGYVTKIDLEGRGSWGFGNKNKVEAQLCEASNPDKPIFRIKGQWNNRIKIDDSEGNTVEEFHINDIPAERPDVEDTEKQTPWESRKAWSKVIKGIKDQDVEQISTHKTAIEQSQRQRRKEEEKQGTQWNRLFFAKQAEDEEAKVLLAQIPNEHLRKFDWAKTAGAWKFVGVQEAEEVRSRLATETSGP